MERTLALIAKAHQGDKEARNTLVEENIGLVYTIVRRFLGRGIEMEDLVQIGSIGLIKAIDNFDIRQPVRFSTYGVPMIVGEIRRYLRDNSTLRVSRSMRDIAYKVLQARERLLRQQQREPTVEQIAQELELPREEVVFAMDAMSAPVSLYEPVYADGGDAVCVMDQIRDDGMIKVSRSLKENALKVFTARERLEKRLGREPAMQELSEETGLSGEDIVMAIESATEVDSIYRTIYQGDGNAISLADRLEEKDNPNERLLDHMVLQEVMATLEEREKRLIEMRYFEEKTQNQVAAALSMTQVQVSRMEKKILKKMRGRFF